MSISIIYKILPNKKINGSLFYAFEYFKFIKDNFKDISIKLIIYNESSDNKNFYFSTFKDKYSGDLENDFKDIFFISGFVDLYNITKTNTKTVYFDVRSYEDTYAFMKSDLLVYVNQNVKNQKDGVSISKNKKLTKFGYYDYQNYDVKTPLKIYFDIHKKPRKTKKGIFVSSPLKISSEYLKHKDFRSKENNKNIENLFEKFDKFVYYHNGKDTNNRLILECYYFGKDIEIIDDIPGKPDIKDSIDYRFNDIKNGKIEKYRLTIEDPMIQEIIK
jgi:hypothetical protein